MGSRPLGLQTPADPFTPEIYEFRDDKARGPYPLNHAGPLQPPLCDRESTWRPLTNALIPEHPKVVDLQLKLEI